MDQGANVISRIREAVRKLRKVNRDALRGAAAAARDDNTTHRARTATLPPSTVTAHPQPAMAAAGSVRHPPQRPHPHHLCARPVASARQTRPRARRPDRCSLAARPRCRSCRPTPRAAADLPRRLARSYRRWPVPRMPPGTRASRQPCCAIGSQSSRDVPPRLRVRRATPLITPVGAKNENRSYLR